MIHVIPDTRRTLSPENNYSIKLDSSQEFKCSVDSIDARNILDLHLVIDEEPPVEEPTNPPIETPTGEEEETSTESE
ncbi:hypothetical protein D3C81_2193210 [compost metagenome]